MAFIRHFFFLLLVMIMSPSLAQGASTFNIVDFGAKAGGTADSSEALKKSWTAACSAAGPATITVPSGRFLVSAPVVFSGTSCKNKAITFKIDGVLVAPDYKVFGNAVLWLSFENVVGVTISGGTLDGQGKTLWDCKMKGPAPDKCPFGVTSLCFSNSQDIVINGLTSTNSQLYHIAINECKNVMLKGVTATAPGDSPNTDGIHVQKSTGVTMLDTKVATGDDCVCLGVGAVNVWIERFACGPGHGISIGSLGKFASEPGVQNVTVKDVKFTGSQNGVRIKSWARASTGFVKGVVFQDATMVNTQNPIIIDQHYCPHAKDCPADASGVKISDVTFKGIHGSSDTQVAVKIDCSSKFPCQDIKMSDIKLTYKGKAAQATCANAKGVATGAIDPPSCLAK